MKKRAIPITVGIAVVALALLVASLRAPTMQVVSMDPDRVILEAGASCAYSIWVNHAPTCADCRYYDGARVISGTSYSRLTVYWDALALGTPASGDCFCGHWHCYDRAEWHGGELWDMVAWRVWLPVVWKE